MAGTRPYVPGDLVAHIHWAASARLSEAKGTDEFVVREFFAEEAPRVALVQDRRPGMAIHAPPSPWLDKRGAVDAAAGLIAASAAAEHGDVVHAETLELVARKSSALPPGSFVFVLSDFLVPVPARLWLRLRARRWDVVPVIVQDPLWEQTFPAVGGVVLPLADPETGLVQDVWLTARESRARARANERRLDELLARFRRLSFDPVVLGTSDPREIAVSFEAWAERRRRLWRVQA